MDQVLRRWGNNEHRDAVQGVFPCCAHPLCKDGSVERLLSERFASLRATPLLKEPYSQAPCPQNCSFISEPASPAGSRHRPPAAGSSGSSRSSGCPSTPVTCSTAVVSTNGGAGVGGVVKAGIRTAARIAGSPVSIRWLGRPTSTLGVNPASLGWQKLERSRGASLNPSTRCPTPVRDRILAARRTFLRAWAAAAVPSTRYLDTRCFQRCQVIP